MNEKILGIAIPFFVLFIVVEIIYSIWSKKDLYRLNDAISSLSCGSVTILVELFSKLPWLFAYAWLLENISITQFAMDSVYVWIGFFILADFFYYWAHRFSHEINFLWSGHLPHHQSEEYNLTTALRQGALQGALTYPIYLPMAILGCQVEMFLVIGVTNRLYQFWIHTRAIEKIPLIEGILNTPSAHRVHHAVNEEYVDKNYGGTFMIFDRMFGTWVEEDKNNKAVYGVRKPYQSFNPVKAHVDWWIRLGKDAYHTKSWKDKIKLWFMPTGWRPEDVQKSHPWGRFDMATFKKYDPKVSNSRKYLSLTLYLMVIITIPFILNLQDISLGLHMLIASAYIFFIYLLNRLNY